jgi:hypothetical protein
MAVYTPIPVTYPYQQIQCRPPLSTLRRAAYSFYRFCIGLYRSGLPIYIFEKMAGPLVAKGNGKHFCFSANKIHLQHQAAAV